MSGSIRVALEGRWPFTEAILWQNAFWQSRQKKQSCSVCSLCMTDGQTYQLTQPLKRNSCLYSCTSHTFCCTCFENISVFSIWAWQPKIPKHWMHRWLKDWWTDGPTNQLIEMQKRIQQQMLFCCYHCCTSCSEDTAVCIQRLSQGWVTMVLIIGEVFYVASRTPLTIW